MCVCVCTCDVYIYMYSTLLPRYFPYIFLYLLTNMPSFAPSSFLSEFSRDLYAFIIRTFIYIAIDCLSISLSATLYRF